MTARLGVEISTVMIYNDWLTDVNCVEEQAVTETCVVLMFLLCLAAAFFLV